MTSIPDIFWYVSFLELENIDVPDDFSLPEEEPVSLNKASTSCNFFPFFSLLKHQGDIELKHS